MKHLTIIPTPIGNMQDLTERARTALSDIDVLFCESITNTKKLYQCLGMPLPKLIRFWQKTEQSVIKHLEAIDAQHVGLISDAGMPCISDPGYTLVKAWIAKGWTLTALPGASCIPVAIAMSGLACENFQFLGFLPPKSEACRKRLEQARQVRMAAVIYESPTRILRLCEDIQVVYGKAHEICVMREISKAYEERFHGQVSQVIDLLTTSVIKGEYCVVIAKAQPEPKWQADALLLYESLGVSQASTLIAKLHLISKSKVYEYLLTVHKG